MMKYYKQLQQDRKEGILTEQQYRQALKELGDSNKKSRPGKLTPMQKKIRKNIRRLTRWFFDVENDRERTPLFIDGTRTLVMSEFLKILNKMMPMANKNPIIAEMPFGTLETEIQDLVEVRRKNLQDSKKLKKDGSARPRLRTIYECQDFFYISTREKLLKLEKPMPLPLGESSSVSGSGSATPPLRSATTITAQPKTLPQPASVPVLQTKTPQQPLVSVLNKIPQPSVFPSGRVDLDFVQQQSAQILQLRKELEELKKSKTRVPKPVPVATAPTLPKWTASVVKKVSIGGATKIPCRNPKCGKDCLVSMVDAQSDQERFCDACWQAKKANIMAISSATGSKRKDNKRKAPPAADKPKSTKKPRAKKNTQVPRPSTPRSGKTLRGTTTPPTIKRSKYQVCFVSCYLLFVLQRHPTC